MGFFGSLFGSDQADAARDAAKIQRRTAKQNERTAREFTSQSLTDLDEALSGALGVYDQAQSGAVGKLDEAMGHLSPYSQAGTTALNQIMGLMGLQGEGASQEALNAFQTSPGFQFQMDQGVSALDKSAAARGNLYSGGQAKALTQFGQGLANQEFNNYLSQLSGLAGSGQAAASGLSNLTAGQSDLIANFGGQRANALLGTGANKANVRGSGLSAITGANAQAGAASAAGIIGAANAQSNALNNLLQLGGTIAGSYLGAPA